MALSSRASQPVRGVAPALGRGTLLVSDPACPPALRAAYAQTWLNVRYALLGSAGRTLLVCAADNTADAAPLAANLAILAAEEGEHTLLVDADPHTPSLAGLFNLNAGAGFASLVRQDSANVASMIQESAVPNLSLLGGGDSVGIPGGIGRAPGLGEVMMRLKSSADRLVLIGSPILTQIDSLDLCPLVDGVLVAVHPGRTHREDAGRAKELLARVRAPLLGVVLTVQRG